MKNRFTIIGAAAIALLASGCATDENSDLVSENNAVRFNAVVANRSRATSTTTASMKEFVVYAFTQKAMLMDGVNVIRDGGSWVYSPDAYWPTSPVNFYAFSPNIVSDMSDVSGTKDGNISGYLNDGTVDLLYSTRIGVVQQAAPVNLNFRHALSNVNVLLSSDNPRIRVVVHHILLNNIYIKGTFDFPEESTLQSNPDVKGKWSMLQNLNKMMLFYAISDDDVATLTHVPTNYTLNNLNTGFVIPQPLVPVSLENGVYSGTYIAVECEIFDTATGAKLWPTSLTPDYMLVPQTDLGRIVYPALSGNVTEWLPGYAYNYNISINNPSVLDKIEFDVSVDGFEIEEM